VGPNTLVRVGARPLLTPADVIQLVAPEAERSRPADATPTTGDALLQHLAPGTALSPDELAAAVDIGIGEVLARLLALEVCGTVERGPDGRYARARGMAAAGS